MSVTALSAPPSHEADLDIQKVVLDVANRKVRGLDRRIDNSIIDGSLDRTIEGASTLSLTVHDPHRVLLESGIFDYLIDVRLDRLYWRLAKVSKNGDDLDLIFEDREVALLRAKSGPKKATRGKVTRAEFALSLVREVRDGGGITFVCPELHARQKIEVAKPEPKTDVERARNRDKGIARGTELTVKGAPADSWQKRTAERVLDVADSAGANEKARLAVMEAVIVESLIRNLAGGDRDSAGVLQVRASTARGMGISNRDIEACVNAFLNRGFTGRGGAITLARDNPTWSAGRVAQAVQGSAFPERYDQARAEAEAFIAAYSGEAVGEVEREIVTRLPYQFRRGTPEGEPEDSWACLQRLAEEVNWRCFMSAGSLYFISENALLRAKPRLILNEDSPGVVSIDFDVDAGKKAEEATIVARASRWIAAPGAVVELAKSLGPAQGRWLVRSISRGLFDADATIMLKRPAKPFREPAQETETTNVTDRARGLALGRAGSMADLAYQAAQAIHNKRYPYIWGGGHARAGVPDGGTGRDRGIGYDCSGSTVAILAAAGMGFTPGGGTATSGTLASWGEAGRGSLITVYANSEHVFLVFHAGLGKGQDEHFGTGDWGKGWNGAGFNPEMHPTGRFTARHWPGT